MLLLCGSSKYLYSPHHPCRHGRSFWNSEREGVSKFPEGLGGGGGGGEVKPEKFNSVRDAWIFSGTSYYHSQSIRGGQ